MDASEFVPAVALCLYVTFLATAFGLRALIQYLRTGDHGLRGLAAGDGVIGLLRSALLLIGSVLAGLAPAAELFHLAQSPSISNATALRAGGLALAVFGMAIAVISQYQMGDSWRVGIDLGESTPLITSGIFGVIRNPIFTGTLLATAGLLLLVPNYFSVAAFLALLVGLEMQVRWVEEPYLERVHGAGYRSYARIAGRFLPGIGRLR